MATLSVHRVSAHYGALQALRGVSFEISTGEVIGILGPNGAGKSTLLKTIAGAKRPSAGSVRLDGKDLHPSTEVRARAGLVLTPEGRGVLADLTVEENLILGCYPCRISRATRRERLAEAYDRFPRLRERATSPAGTLSGGEAAMLAVSRSLMSHPSIVLLDEPSLGLSPAMTTALFSSLTELKRQGQTMVIVEQRARQLLALADMIAVLVRGEARMVVRTSDVTEEQLQDLYLGSATGAPDAMRNHTHSPGRA